MRGHMPRNRASQATSPGCCTVKNKLNLREARKLREMSQ